jgi:hypothetical protein
VIYRNREERTLLQLFIGLCVFLACEHYPSVRLGFFTFAHISVKQIVVYRRNTGSTLDCDSRSMKLFLTVGAFQLDEFSP